uniref:Uncharacterized protein n=1 Tax=Paenarthrobacter aurescens TaxID=43663 RepID=Q6SK30_PAEAU|nr:hypothetical protein [Paenarthrobacter aurescens]
MIVSRDEARFWHKVIKGPRTNDCWLWTGAVGDDGYGRYWIKIAGGYQAPALLRHSPMCPRNRRERQPPVPGNPGR